MGTRGPGRGQLHLGLELLHFFAFFLFCKRRGGGSALRPRPSPSHPLGTVTHLGHTQDHQEIPEDVDKVEEEIDAVPAGTEGHAQGGPSCPLRVPPLRPCHLPDVILVPTLRLLDDELRVEEHEATGDHQPQVEVGLWEGEGTLDGDIPYQGCG